MDPQSLFNKSGKPGTQNKSRTLCVGNELDDQVLVYGLNSQNFDIKSAPADKRFEWIKGGSVDIGFISALDFAYLKGGWKVFPGICKSSFGMSKRSLLFFNKYLTNIDTVAVSPATRTSRIALNVILRERYQIECKFVETDDTLDNSLKKYDAMLLTGDSALLNSVHRSSFLDISEEWRDMTGLPLVYGFWIGNEMLKLKNESVALAESVKQGIENYSAITKTHLPGTDNRLKLNYLQNAINYQFSEEQQAGLDELYRYAFFYGITPYIPDFNFIGSELK